MDRTPRYLAALGVTATGIAASALFTFVAPAPLPVQGVLYAIPLAGVVFAGYGAGLGPAIASATVASVYAIVHYYSLAGIFPAPSDRIMLASGVVVLTFGIALVGGYQKRRADDMAMRLLDAERAHTAELTRTNKALAESNRALAATNDGLESFSYVVSHDLKEPVRAMAALLEEAEEKAIRPEVKDNVRKAREANERLSKLLTGLIEVARATHLNPGELRSVDVLDALASDECQARLRDIARARDAILETRSLHGTPPALATTGHLAQILGNLVTNAIRHNPKPSPKVRVSVARDPDGRHVEVHVDDDGPGFDPSVVERIGQLKPGRPASVRGGFGLVIVARAVERLGGRLWIARSPDLGGASVRFTLPAADATRTGAQRAQRDSP